MDVRKQEYEALIKILGERRQAIQDSNKNALLPSTFYIRYIRTRETRPRLLIASIERHIIRRKSQHTTQSRLRRGLGVHYNGSARDRGDLEGIRRNAQLSPRALFRKLHCVRGTYALSLGQSSPPKFAVTYIKKVSARERLEHERAEDPLGVSVRERERERHTA